MIQTVTNASVIVGTSDVSAWTGDIQETPGSVGEVDATTFATGGFAAQVPAIKSGRFQLVGFADFDASGVSSLFTPANLGTQYGVSVAIPGTAVGDPAVFGAGRLSGIPFGVAPDAAGTFALNFATDGAFAAGWVGAPLASRTTSGFTGAGVNFPGPASGRNLYALLQVTAASGTNLVVKVQSDDNSGFTSATDRITFSTLSATGWERSSVAGPLTTETYWRVVATIASGSFTFRVVFGIA